MQKAFFLLFVLSTTLCFSQKSDFKHINFAKADRIASTIKSKRLFNLNKLTLDLTKNLYTDIEKVRAIYKWICLNIASDFKLYSKNERKRKKYKKDSIKLAEWNSELKRDLFSKLLKRKKTICTGYAYLFKAMCDVVDIESKMVYGFGRTVDITEFDPNYPNHTWNAFKINNKWYLCDATWAAGISYPDENRFIFKYNDGYFLTEPELFIKNHFPIQKEFSLLGDKMPTFQEFIEMPLLYGGAYTYLNKYISPKKMYYSLQKGNIFNFNYVFKKEVDPKNLKLVFVSGVSEKTYNPFISQKNDTTTLKYTFNKAGYFDVHLYYKEDIIATYIFEIKKDNKN